MKFYEYVQGLIKNGDMKASVFSLNHKIGDYRYIRVNTGRNGGFMKVSDK